MHLVKSFFSFAFCLLLFAFSTNAQTPSHIRISLLTCSPGDELYSTFGHSALRITDSNNVYANNQLTDSVYNYGTFDFDDDGFYLKFIRGKLLYYVSVEDFNGPDGFENEYQSDNRSITEQVLNFTDSEKIQIEHALNENLKDENKYYKYDFFFDNCTTRLRDLIAKYKHPTPQFKAIMPPSFTYRQAIYQYLDSNNHYWSKLTIDLLLGAKTDAAMTTATSQFLPDNLMRTLDSSNANHQLVLSKTNLYPINETTNGVQLFTPMVVFSLLFLLIVLLGFSKNKFIQKSLQGFDGLLFFLIGMIGVIIIFMWTATDHSLCKDNYNLLWAWPTHLVAAFFINSKKQWMKKYLATTIFGSVCVLLAWFFLPQSMNDALIPIILLLIYRSTIKWFQIDGAYL